MRTNYLCHLANIIDIQWLTCSKRQKCGTFEVADKHDAVLEVIDGQPIL